MRPRHQAPRDQLAAVLGRHAAVRAAELAEQLGVSLPTLHRLLIEQGPAILSTGQARRTRYALRRALRGDLAPLPLYAVDAAGRADLVAQLALVHPQGSHMDLAGTGWPVPEAARDGWWDGLPYPLIDMRPQGYLGRQLARAQHQALRVSSNPDDWSDDDVVHVLSHLGSDVSGNLILGNAAFERWQTQKHLPQESTQGVKPRALGRTYLRLAEQAVAAGVPGSSTAGEFPKFPALRELAGSQTPHVLVKFSGADASPAVQRWADLLVAEHIALTCVATLPGGTSASSRLVTCGGRSFLEVERFDRHGAFGRSPLISLAVLDAALLGAGTSDWGQLAARLHAAGLLSADDVLRTEHLWWFGRLIANSDMHLGNLSFRTHGHTGMLSLAPAYDMLPMLYAPLPGGELPARAFKPALPLPAQRAKWMTACAAAIHFWDQVSKDSRVSEGFRKTCGANAHQLRSLRDRL